MSKSVLIFFTALSALFVPIVAAESASPVPAKVAVPETPTGFPGAESFVYRALSPVPLRLHVVKPKDWSTGDRRPAFMFFFGGGWVKGGPDHSISWANWAAKLGLVGIAPDYRVRDRFGTSPLEAVADARAAVRWIEDHAEELGIDPKRIVVGGSSAGGHLALWTAITHNPPGSAANENPLVKPAALILTSPVSDTSAETGYAPSRFGPQAAALSAVHHLDARMPPVLVFHGDADKTVPQRQSLALRDRLIAGGNVCEFVNVPGGAHSYSTSLPEWKDKTRTMIRDFLARQHLVVEGAR